MVTSQLTYTEPPGILTGSPRLCQDCIKESKAELWIVALAEALFNASGSLGVCGGMEEGHS